MGTAQPIRVAIDIETTGLQAEFDAIIEIGAVRFRGTENLETFETIINPRKHLPYRIQRLTNITPAMLKGQPYLADIAPRLRTFIADYPLVGHSVGFDADFLRRSQIGERNTLLDTYELASFLIPSLQSYSLESVATHLQLPPSIHHRALADAELARDVLLALEERITKLPDHLLITLCSLGNPSDLPFMGLLHHEQRTRGLPAHQSFGGGGSTFGAAVNSKLGVDPAVLGTALAAQPEAMPNILIASSSEPKDIDTTTSTLVMDTFSANETTFIEIGSSREAIDQILIPALTWAIRGQQRLIIAAPTVAAIRDLTLHHLPRAIGKIDGADESVTVSTLYEARDYLCTHRWYGPGRDVAQQTPEGLRGLAKLSTWVQETTTGARSELSLNPKEQSTWELVRAGREFMEMPKCAYRERGWCFAQRAQEAAAKATIIITTHAAVLSSASLAGTKSATPYVPNADGYLFLDTQQLEERVIQQATRSVGKDEIAVALDLLWHRHGQQSRGILAQAAQTLPNDPTHAEWEKQVNRAAEALQQLLQAFATLLHDANTTGPNQAEARLSTLRLDQATRGIQGWNGVVSSWRTAAKRIHALADTVALAAKSLVKIRGSESLMLELTASDQWLRQLQQWGNEVIEQPQTDMLYWIRPQQAFNRFGSRGRPGVDQPEELPSIHSAPVNGAAFIAPALTKLGKGIILSGTALTIDSSFDYMSDRLGVPPSSHQLIAAANEAYQTTLLVPNNAPEPNTNDYQKSLNEALLDVVSTLQGRTIALFASHSAMRTTYTVIKPLLEKQDIMVLAQGIDGSQRQLWQNFRSQERVFIMGAGGIWDTLDSEDVEPACIFIARLPLAATNDPLLEARAGAYTDPMQQFIVPYSTLRLRQTLNKLAWQHQRRNVIIMYDRRIIAKGYGVTMFHSLPATTYREADRAMLGTLANDWLNIEG